MFGEPDGLDEPTSSEFFANWDDAERRSKRAFDAKTSHSSTGFGIVALGMLCLAAGAAMTKSGYMGGVARYAANELAPVGKDAINYMAVGTAGGVETMASAVGRGLMHGQVVSKRRTMAQVRCRRCNVFNRETAKFCNECGAGLHRVCGGCKGPNDGDARFCDNCGRGFARA